MNVNKVMLVGRVGADPQIRESAKGNIANISLATSSGYGDNEKVDWHRVTFFGKIADTVSEYVKKGQELYVEGRISYSKYTDKSGVEKYSTDIIAYSMQMGRKANSSPAQKDDDDLPF
jgi:single-strand DNA-binding protein|tara:strand:- start:1246 stop:1599 length:354 start_codon:yes stop_codon:yes gene_type:complete